MERLFGLPIRPAIRFARQEANKRVVGTALTTVCYDARPTSGSGTARNASQGWAVVDDPTNRVLSYDVVGTSDGGAIWHAIAPNQDSFALPEETGDANPTTRRAKDASSGPTP